jgi:uroporphyrin-III C-methyltransferase/precorrin-2 dehydrogenase/sirohydrochlorin ferrochelatase
MDYLPLFFNLKAKQCLVVGGGQVAARKIELLGRVGANITVIAPDIKPELYALEKTFSLTIKKSSFHEHDLSNYVLVICATDDIKTNQQIAKLAKAQRIPINVVDDPELSTFIFPAIIDRSPVMIATSSSGSSPVLTRLLRAKLETLIPPGYGKLAQLAEKYREKVKITFPKNSQRKRFWENVLQGPIAELVFAGNLNDAETLLNQHLETFDTKSVLGEVYLIGAGPGAADLLTFRALRLLQQADVVVYDRLVSAEVLDLARRDAEKIYVGKQRSQHTLAQTTINQLLAELALEGKRVARLKGGDPFIFGRGGEEIETLLMQGIQFQVVPGITAASGCASYAGIPLTHRDHAQSCLFVTGHLKDDSVNLNWSQLVLPNQTVVIYMGLIGVKQICEAMLCHGGSPDLPIALIQQGTTENQIVYTGTLATLPANIEYQDIKPPTLIIIGNVVSLRKKLNWFDSPVNQ